MVRRHRRSGVGQAFAAHVWDLYRSPWVVRVFQGNLPAVPFWRGAVARYTDGSSREEVREVNGRKWSYFLFDRSNKGITP
ncbi:MAG: hypothetical protein HC809_03095 [Gammaproteobacteria bacterium]|nr:hypothetical protein [Gammaproteobacteria bacterium]